MGTATEQIRVSESVKNKPGRLRRDDESYNDVLERVLDEATAGDFFGRFGRLSDAAAARVRKRRRQAKERRKRRMRE